MKDEQFEILVNLINETKEELTEKIVTTKEELTEKIATTKEELTENIATTKEELTNSQNSLESRLIKKIDQSKHELEISLGKLFLETKEEIKRERKMNEEEHQQIRRLIGENAYHTNKRIDEMQEDINTLYAIFQMNNEQH